MAYRESQMSDGKWKSVIEGVCIPEVAQIGQQACLN